MRLAADANVLLSAVLGHSALRLIDEANVDPVTTMQTLREVREHLAPLAEKYGLDPDILRARLEALGVVAFGPRKYRAKLAEARRRIQARDPDDVPLLALALTLETAVWSNDNDFEHAGIEWYTTARLLAKFGLFGKGTST